MLYCSLDGFRPEGFDCGCRHGDASTAALTYQPVLYTEDSSAGQRSRGSRDPCKGGDSREEVPPSFLESTEGLRLVRKLE